MSFPVSPLGSENEDRQAVSLTLTPVYDATHAGLKRGPLTGVGADCKPLSEFTVFQPRQATIVFAGVACLPNDRIASQTMHVAETYNQFQKIFSKF